jgi:hypothetical protein
VIVDVVFDVTAFVVILYVAVETPAGTDTEVATTADLEEDANLTLMAPVLVDAVAFKVTVPVEEVPPVTEVGDTDRDVIRNGFTDSAAD